MCLALDSDYLWNCCTCSSIERGFSLVKHLETLFVNVTFMSAIVSFNIQNSIESQLSRRQEQSLLSCVVSGSALLRSVDAQNVSILDVAAFYNLFGVFLIPPPRYMKICNTCLYHVEKAQQLLIFLFLFLFFFFNLTKVSAALDAVCFRCLSLYFL